MTKDEDGQSDVERRARSLFRRSAVGDVGPRLHEARPSGREAREEPSTRRRVDERSVKADLLARMAGEATASKTRLDANLIVRGSTAPPAQITE